MKNCDIQMSGHEKRYRSEEIAPPPVHLPNGGAFTAFVNLGGESVDNGPKSERLVVAQPPSFSSASATTTLPPSTLAPSEPEASPVEGDGEAAGKMEKLLAVAMERLKMMQHMGSEEQ